MPLLLNRYTWIAAAILGVCVYVGFLHMEVNSLKDFRSKTEAFAKAEASRLQVEARQRTEVTQHAQQTYDQQLASINRRLAELGMRNSNNPSPMPALPDAAQSAPPTSASTSDELSCAADYARETAKLTALQQWVRENLNVTP